MKFNLSVLTLILAAFLVSSLAGFVLYTKKVRGYSYCHGTLVDSLKAGKTYGTLAKVVVKPWKGEHNVYAIFMLPNEEKPKKVLIVNMPKDRMYCGGVQKVGTYFEGVEAKPGYYLVKASLRTRTSAFLIAKGYLKQLKDPRNWNLV